MTMSDRIAVMRHGRVEQLGEPETLYERPATAFVAGFLGTSNLLEGRVEGRIGPLIEVATPSGPVRGTLDRESGVPAERGAAVRVGVRPEKLSLRTPRERGDGGGRPAEHAELNALPAVVVDASYLGVSTQYTVRTDSGGLMTVYTQNSAPETSSQLRPGASVEVTWRPEHTFVFAETEATQHEGETDV